MTDYQLPRGRPPKRLLELIVTGTFRVSRHQELLAGESLPERCPLPGRRRARLWKILRHLQLCCHPTLELTANELREAACDVAAVVRALHGVGEMPAWLEETLSS